MVLVMKSTREQLLDEIDAFLSRSGMNVSDFGQAVMGDRSFVQRLRRGRKVQADSVDKIRLWLSLHGAPRPRPRRRQTNEAVV